MALAKECDACGDFFKPSKDETIPNGITFTYFDFQGRAQSTIDKKELCPDCIQKVPDEYANNPLGYLMSLNMPQQQMNPMVNMFNMLMRR